MSLAKASIWTAGSTLIKIGAGLLVVKLLAVAFGPSGVGQAGNFRQLITVLGVLSGAGIFNGITKYVAEYHQDPQRLRLAVGTASSIVLGFLHAAGAGVSVRGGAYQYRVVRPC
jgi:enterobacterial common antigen flippase